VPLNSFVLIGAGSMVFTPGLVMGPLPEAIAAVLTARSAA
jgi:hypothetical protein